MSEKTENLMKETAKQFGMTYREIGEAIGYSEAAIKSAAATGKVSEPMQRAIELYFENQELHKEVKETEQLKQLLKKFIG